MLHILGAIVVLDLPTRPVDRLDSEELTLLDGIDLSRRYTYQLPALTT